MRIGFWILAMGLLSTAAAAQVAVVRGTQPITAAAVGGWWKPSPGSTFDVQLNDPSSAGKVPNVQVVELDIDIDPKIIAAVKARGTKLICYFNAGAWESYRADTKQFPKAVLGKKYDGFPDEKWLDIRNISALAPLMRARLDRCKAKGFDAVDPDNVNGFENSTGFPLTASHQIAYNTWLANEAHARGLGIALKNTTSLASQMVSAGFDFAVTESCFKYNFCNELAPFRSAGKAVLNLEYTDEKMTLAKFCAGTKALGIDAILKRSSGKIDNYRKVCP
jgi:hypothetical protein